MNNYMNIIIAFLTLLLVKSYSGILPLVAFTTCKSLILKENLGGIRIGGKTPIPP